ncbi:UNVERIFIED_CONTAM: hypothetical protein FKN15_013042 [Acipenser sinensis]
MPHLWRWHYVARCPFLQEREEQGPPRSPPQPPPAEGGRLLLPPPQQQQRPEEPENLFPWCTWCGKEDHRWRDCSEIPPGWCGQCEEEDWSGCPYATPAPPRAAEPPSPYAAGVKPSATEKLREKWSSRCLFHGQGLPSYRPLPRVCTCHCLQRDCSCPALLRLGSTAVVIVV